MSELGAIPPPVMTSQVITSRQDRKNAGVSSYDYVDAYNNAMAIDNERAYNEYLYNRYSSPSAYMKQLEEAGLNSAFAVGGSPSSSPSSSTQSFNSNVSQAHQISLNNKLAIFNSILSGISQGVNIISNTSAIPQDQAYRVWRNAIAGIDAGTHKYKSDSAFAKSIADMIYYLGYQSSGYLDKNGNPVRSPYSVDGSETIDPYHSMFVNQQALRNALMEIKNSTASWDLNNLKPAQLEQLNKMIENISGRTSFLGLQEDMYSALKASGLLAPIIVALIKGFM